MTEQAPSSPTAEPYAADGARRAPWAHAIDEFRKARTCWVATVHPTGRPHAVPVLAVVTGNAVHFAAGPATQKARNLARNPRLTVTTGGDTLDVVVEGVADRVADEGALAAVVEAYADKYGWEVEVRDGALHGDGAPTAGPPPYHVYRLVPQRAFGFPTTGDAAPTRWRFRQLSAQ